MAADLKGPIRLERIIHVYKFWINTCIQGSSLSDVTVLEKDLSDGKVLLYLISYLTGEMQNVLYENAEDNVDEVLKFLKRQDVLCDIDVKAITRGELHPILDVIWLLILHFDIHSKGRAPYQRTFRLGQILLLEWLQYELPEIEIDCKKPIRHILRSGLVIYNIIQKHFSLSSYKFNPIPPGNENMKEALELTASMFTGPSPLLCPLTLFHDSMDDVTLTIYLTLLRRKISFLAGPQEYVISPIYGKSSVIPTSADMETENTEDDLSVCLEYIHKKAQVLEYTKESIELKTILRVSEQCYPYCCDTIINRDTEDIYQNSTNFFYPEKRLQDELSLLASENYHLTEQLNKLHKCKIENYVLKKLLDSANKKAAILNKKVEQIEAQTIELQMRLTYTEATQLEVNRTHESNQMNLADHQSRIKPERSESEATLQMPTTHNIDVHHNERNHADAYHKSDYSRTIFDGNNFPLVQNITHDYLHLDGPFDSLLDALKHQVEFSRYTCELIIAKTCKVPLSSIKLELFLSNLKKVILRYEKEMNELNFKNVLRLSGNSTPLESTSTTHQVQLGSIMNDLLKIESSLDNLQMRKKRTAMEVSNANIINM